MHHKCILWTIAFATILATAVSAQETVHSFTDAAGTTVEYMEYGYSNPQDNVGDAFTVAPGATSAAYTLNDSGSVIGASCSSGCDSGCDSCGGMGCDLGIVSSCDGCGSGVCGGSCIPWWAHRTGGFGEVLYLAPASADLIYAREQTGPNPNASPTGPLGISNIDAHAGFRAGLTYAFSDCCSLVASYSRWDGDTLSQIDANSPYVLDSLLIHPSTATTGAASLSATADQQINFQVVDAMFRKAYKTTGQGVLNWNGGLRYGNLEQGLIGTQTVSVATGLTTVTTDVDFSGWGIIGGLDGARKARDTGFLVYGKTFGSLLAGNWSADYTQVNQFGGGVIANTYEDFRITPVVDAELGVGWQSAEGHLQLSAGYLFSTWFNAVNNRDYIQSVRSGNLLELYESVSFTGLTGRIELRL